jgi:hypothetical protein
MEMSGERDAMSQILGDLELLRDRENKLIGALTAVIDPPAGPNIPEHIRRVLELSKSIFEGGAAQFLLHRHWKLNGQEPIVAAQSEEGAHEVEMLLIRIINGICA